MNRKNLRRFVECSGIPLLLTLMVSTSVAAPIPAPAPGLAIITLELKAPAYQFTFTGDGYTTIQAEDCGLAGEPGQTLLPHQLVDVALPPDVDWDSLSLAVRDVQTTAVPGTHKLRVAVPDQSGDDPALDPVPAPAAGAPPTARIAATGQMRKWHLARVDFCPFQYDEASGQIRVVEQATVELRLARTGEAPSTTLLADTALDDVAAERFVNYATAQIWYPQVDRPNAATYDYVIVTTNAIEANCTKLAPFVTHKQAKGFQVLVITEDDYGGLTGQTPNGRAEKVRQWLKNNYATYGIEYVLLIGNPTPGGTSTTAVPMKMCWPRRDAADDRESPTDYFFADLTGNWDKDGDTFYGEWGDDWGAAGGVNFDPEVYVGRIPFYGNYTDLNNILQKSMDYANETNTSWRKSILLPMGFQKAGYDGAPLAEQMWGDYLSGSGYSRWRQYQQGNGACGPNSIYASDQELRGGTVVRDRWAAINYGIVCWWGHGSQTSTSVGYGGCWDGTLFSSSQTNSLDDDHPAFTYQNSCTNGYPENSNNLGYAVLKRGGIATVNASRVSWFNTGVGYGDFDGSTTNSGIGYEYVKRVVAGNTASESLYNAKSSMMPEYDTRLMNYYDFNLYGDPSVQIERVISGVEISGPSSLSMGRDGSYSVTYSPASAAPPVSLAWDNGTTGSTATYSWAGSGTYTIVVTATNPYGQVQGTYPVTVFCQPVTDVTVEGPRALLVGETKNYRVTAYPEDDVSYPFSFQWTDGITLPAVYDSHTITLPFSWTVTGTHTLVFTATNPCGQAIESIEVKVLSSWPYSIYLPLALREYQQ